MFKWLKSLFTKIGDSKFWKFLVEVFEGKTGTFLDENYAIINRSVQITEEIAEYVILNKEKPFEELLEEIELKFGTNLTFDNLKLILENKSTGKFALAYNLVIEEMKANGKEFVETLFRQSLSLGIEMAVNRFFGK